MYNSKSSEGKKLIHDAHEYYPSLIDPTNVDGIVDAIVYMLDHSEEVKMMSENERIAMKEKYNWEQMKAVA